MNEPEVKMKTFIWMRSNGDFMRVRTLKDCFAFEKWTSSRLQEKEKKMKIKEEEEERLKNDPNAKKKRPGNRKYTNHPSLFLQSNSTGLF